MDQENKYSTFQKAVLNAALKLMFNGNFDSATRESVSDMTGLNLAKLESAYPSDDELRMSAMEYAAVVWSEQVKMELSRETDVRMKFRKLLRMFAAGSESHPDSLSLYIDVWKKIRDSQNGPEGMLKDRLLGIYQYYVSLFEEILAVHFGDAAIGRQRLRDLAWIMVVISDGFHIQGLLQDNRLDFDSITGTLTAMLDSIINHSEGLP